MKLYLRISILIMLVAHQLFVTPAFAQQAIIVDDQNTGFSKGGSYWQDDGSRGYNNHIYWTCVNGNSVDSWGEWRPNLPSSGAYEVFTYIPDYHTNTQHAPYEIHHRDGVTTVPVAQAPYSNQWVSLGTFNFTSGTAGFVRLTDATGESASCATQIGFDAIKWVSAASAPTTDCATFQGDVNIPDGTTVSPGQSFNKGWQLANCGNTTWSGYQAVRISGSFGPSSFGIPNASPGQTATIATNITAPTSAGTYRATYKLSGPNGQFGDSFWVEIIVSASTSADCAAFQSDINIPDGTTVSPGQIFNKGWRLANCGNTTWNGYQAVRISGSFGPSSFGIPNTGPGQTATLATDITAPTSAGRYRATYQLRGPNGQFGDPFWVEVVVTASTTGDCAAFQSDLNMPDGTTVSPGQTFNKGWRLSNCGSTTWSGYQAVRISGSFGPATIAVGTTGPNQSVDISTGMTAPASAGNYTALYQLRGPNGQFGDRFWVQITVGGSGSDCAAYQRDITIPDGTYVNSGQALRKGWVMRNCGPNIWVGYSAVRVEGDFGPTSFTIPSATPGQAVEVWADIMSPNSAGTHRATYKLQGPQGVFGDAFWVEIAICEGSSNNRHYRKVFELNWS